MTFSIKQGVVAEMLGIAVKLIEARNTHPITECVRIRFGGEHIAFDATNFEQWATVETPGFDPAKCQTAIVPGRQLHSILSNLSKDSDIKMSVTATQLKIETVQSKYSFGLMSPDGWPALDWETIPGKFDVNGAELARILKFCLPSIGNEAARVYLNGINIRPGAKKSLRFWSGDGRRSSMTMLPTKAEIPLPENGIIIPRKLVSFYIELIENAPNDTPVSLELGPQRCRFHMAGNYNVSVIGRLIDSVYPNMDRLAPYDREQGINTLPRQATIEALRRLEIIADEKKRYVMLEFADGAVVLSTQGPHGEARETLAVSKQDHNTKVSFNSGLLLSLLSSFSYDDITLMIDKQDSFTIGVLMEKEESLSKEATQPFCLIMPMRV